jgi:drug/metabolite transporter (DMT)-like permease
MEVPAEPIPPATPLETGVSMRVRMFAAFAAIYIIWGSTYLAIRFAIASMPPFLMAGARFLTAGALLYVVMRLRGEPRPTWRQWIGAGITGVLLLVTGNGAVVYAEKTVASSVVALILAMTPLWMTLFDWWRPGGSRPSRAVFIGLGLGFAGMVLLIGPSNLVNAPQIDPLGAGLVLFASLAWAVGSIYSRYAKLPNSPLVSTGVEMLSGGAVMMLLSVIAGDWALFHIEQVTATSWLAWGYLVLAALVAFSAYVWLLKHAQPARVATYAYVNPVIAVFLGWALASEPLTAQTLIAAAVIVAAVVIIITYHRPEKT